MRGVQAAHEDADERLVEQVPAGRPDLGQRLGVNEMVVHGWLTTTSALCLRRSGLGAR